MTYHSDYDTYGFRRDEILSILERHGIVLDIGESGRTTELPPTATPYPQWKQALARRKRLTVFEAACALGGIDPFTEAETVEHYGVNAAAFDMNKALLDEAIDDGLIQSFEKREGSFTQHLIKAEGFSTWCDSIGLERPLPWNFERFVSATDTEQRHEVEKLQQQLTQATAEVRQLRILNDSLASDPLNHMGHESEIESLKTELDQLKHELSTAKSAPSGSLSFRYETDLLKLAAAAQGRYLSETYDPRESDTRPRKDDVIEWLKKQDASLSTVSAEAIDRVAMPFNRSK